MPSEVARAILSPPPDTALALGHPHIPSQHIAPKPAFCPELCLWGAPFLKVWGTTKVHVSSLGEVPLTLLGVLPDGFGFFWGLEIL